MTLESSGLLDVEIIDVSVDDDDGFPLEQIQWADACVIVYSITDRLSFEYAVRSLGELRQLQNSPSAYLVANKADLDHLREVSCFLKNISPLTIVDFLRIVSETKIKNFRNTSSHSVSIAKCLKNNPLS